MIQDAVIRNLEIIGEAVKNISPNTRRSAPEVPWQKIAGLRDVLSMIILGLILKVFGLSWKIACRHSLCMLLRFLRKDNRNGIGGVYLIFLMLLKAEIEEET